MAHPASSPAFAVPTNSLGPLQDACKRELERQVHYGLDPNVSLEGAETVVSLKRIAGRILAHVWCQPENTTYAIEGYIDCDAIRPWQNVSLSKDRYEIGVTSDDMSGETSARLDYHYIESFIAGGLERFTSDFTIVDASMFPGWRSLPCGDVVWRQALTRAKVEAYQETLFELIDGNDRLYYQDGALMCRVEVPA